MKFSGFSHMKNAEICICMKHACFRCYNSSRALIFPLSCLCLQLCQIIIKIIYSASVSTRRLLALTVVQNLINSLLTEMIIHVYIRIKTISCLSCIRSLALARPELHYNHWSMSTHHGPKKALVKFKTLTLEDQSYYNRLKYIVIELGDSVSRDGPDMPYINM